MVEEPHPIFGRLLHDFGYKRLYAQRMSELLNPKSLPVWESQRSFRKDRVRGGHRGHCTATRPASLRASRLLITVRGDSAGRLLSLARTP